MWGADLRRTMLDYNFYAGLGIVGEVLPQMKNMVKLHETQCDQYGLPVAHVIFSHHENDKKMVAHAKVKMSEILEAAGWGRYLDGRPNRALAWDVSDGKRSQNSVVNADCRSHDIPNLFICDGSVFTTSTGVNPSLTIEAIAARTADRIRESFN